MGMEKEIHFEMTDPDEGSLKYEGAFSFENSREVFLDSFSDLMK